MTLRLAMWSGPRNISTAMMRAFENRPDTQVVDEPFYACYLHCAGVRHPMQDEVLASQPTDWETVARQLTEDSIPADVYYQKHMTHHMLPNVDLAWARQLTHCFLIRNPYQVVGSYAQKRETVTVDDIGIKRQYELYREIIDITGQDVPVLDARATLLDPETTLRALCGRLGIEFADSMLHWPQGRRTSDGVWASHWYQSVEASTGFRPYGESELKLTADQQAVALASMPYYERLLARSEQD